MPTPGDFARQPRNPLTARPVVVPVRAVPASPATPDRPVPRVADDAPFLARYELAVRYSSLPPTARLVALVLALRADWTTGVTAPSRRSGYGRIADSTGLNSQKIRDLLALLGEAGFLRRHPAAYSDQVSVIELLIPAGLDPVR